MPAPMTRNTTADTLHSRVKVLTRSGRDFGGGILIVGRLDDVVDDGAARGIARGDLHIGFRRRRTVAFGRAGSRPS